jgi:AraC-like DNA-binding protein
MPPPTITIMRWSLARPAIAVLYVLVRVDDRVEYHRPGWLDGIETLHAAFRRHRYPLHVHGEWTIALIERGAARFRLGRAEHVATEGAVVVIPTGVVHSGEPIAPAGYRYRALYLDPEALGLAVGATTPRAASGTILPPGSPFHRPLTNLHRLLGDEAGSLARESLTFAALGRIAPLLGVAPTRRRPSRRAAVRDGCEFLREHSDRHTSLEELARAVGMGGFALVHAFTEELGISPHRYQLALRVERAKRLLRAGETPAAVALETGFYDQAHLTRVFRRIVGVPPGRFAQG